MNADDFFEIASELWMDMPDIYFAKLIASTLIRAKVLKQIGGTF